MLFILLIDDSPFNNLDMIWGKIDVHTCKERISYVLSKFGKLSFCGPTVGMAQMAINQSNRPFSRGMLRDCMHIGYLSSCKYMISSDKHFIEFANTLPESLSKKIINLESFIQNVNE